MQDFPSWVVQADVILRAVRCGTRVLASCNVVSGDCHLGLFHHPTQEF